MKLEPANIVCPKCGSPNYMRHLIGKGVGKLDMKCINCNSYFSFEELYKQKIAEVIKPKPQTNADRIRAMTDDELADLLTADCKYIPEELCRKYLGNCNACLREWLKQEVDDGNGIG